MLIHMAIQSQIRRLLDEEQYLDERYNLRATAQRSGFSPSAATATATSPTVPAKKPLIDIRNNLFHDHVDVPASGQCPYRHDLGYFRAGLPALRI